MDALIAALLAAILSAFGLSGRAERGIEAHLRQTLGPVGQVKVEVHRGHRSPFSRQVDRVEITLVDFDAPAAGAGLRIGGGGDLVGKVGRVAIHARNLRLRELPVEQLEIVIKDVRYDLWKAIWRHRLEVIRVGPSYAEATLTPEALSRMLAARTSQVQNPQLAFAPGKITVSGRLRWWLPIPVRLTCGLAARNHGQIYLVNPRAQVSIVPLPSFVVTRLVAQVNPVVDLNQRQEGPFELVVTAIRVTTRHLRLRAALHARQ